MGVLHSFSIKNIFYDEMDLRLFYFRVIFEVKLKKVLTHVKSIFHI